MSSGENVSNSDNLDYDGVVNTDSTTIDGVDYLALLADKRESQKKSKTSSSATPSLLRKRPKKTALTPALLTGPFGLSLLAKKLRASGIKRSKTAKPTMQLAKILDVYDTWAKELIPGCNLETFFTNLEKVSQSALVRPQLNVLIANKSGDLDIKEFTSAALQTSEQTPKVTIRQEQRPSTFDSYDVGDDDEIELELEDTDYQPKLDSEVDPGEEFAINEPWDD